jgi:hypothetical protein
MRVSNSTIRKSKGAHYGGASNCLGRHVSRETRLREPRSKFRGTGAHMPKQHSLSPPQCSNLLSRNLVRVFETRKKLLPTPQSFTLHIQRTIASSTFLHPTTIGSFQTCQTPLKRWLKSYLTQKNSRKMSRSRPSLRCSRCVR